MKNVLGKCFSLSSSRAGSRTAVGARAAIPLHPVSKNQQHRSGSLTAAGAGVIPAAGTGFPSDESLLKDLKHARSGYKAAHVLYCYFFIAASLGQERVIRGAAAWAVFEVPL